MVVALEGLNLLMSKYCSTFSSVASLIFQHVGHPYYEQHYCNPQSKSQHFEPDITWDISPETVD